MDVGGINVIENRRILAPCRRWQLIFGVSTSDKPASPTYSFLIIFYTFPPASLPISSILLPFPPKLIEQQRFPFLPFPCASAHFCHFFSHLLSFTFFILHILPYLHLYNISSHLNYQTADICPTTFFLHFHPFFAVFRKRSNFMGRGCINYKATVYRHII